MATEQDASRKKEKDDGDLEDIPEIEMTDDLVSIIYRREKISVKNDEENWYDTIKRLKAAAGKVLPKNIIDESVTKLNHEYHKRLNDKTSSSDSKQTDNKLITLNNSDMHYLASQFEPYWIDHVSKDGLSNRDGMISGMAGYMFSNKISVNSAEFVVRLLHDDKDYHLESRLERVRKIYLSGSRNERIDGYDLLIDLLTPLMENKPDSAKDFLKKISKIWQKYSDPILREIDQNILEELSKHTFELISEKPKTFVIARNDTKQIVQAVIDYPKIKGADPDIMIKPRLYYKDIIIQAIPTQIIRHEDPASPDVKYEIEFETPLGHRFKTDPLPLENIVDYLKCKGLVYKMRVADETLAQILQAYERDGKVQITHNIEATGFFLIDGKLECFGFEFKRPTKESMKDCAGLMTKLVVDKYKNDKRLPTLLKWFVNAPFNYIRKSYKTWMVFPHLNGIPSTAKSTRCDVGMGIWRIHNNDEYNVPFANIDSLAKLGKVIGRTTFPIVVSEVGRLNDERRFGHYVETIKSCIEFPKARAAHDRKGRYIEYPARAPLALTGNGVPPMEGGYLSRIIDIQFTTEDQHPRGSKEADEFQAWLTPELDKMGVLGDFTYYYVKEHLEILKKPWKDAGIDILTEFYKAADMDIPPWINLTIDTQPLQDATNRTRLLIKEYLINLINFNYSRLTRPTDNLIPNIADKLKTCCENTLIAFIQYNHKNGRYFITANIMDGLKKEKLDGLVGNLEGLAHMMGFECGNNRVMGTTMHSISVGEVTMRKLLTSQVEEDLTVQKKIDETPSNSDP